MTLYTFTKILSKYIEITLLLLPTLPIFYLIFLALSIIYIPLLLTIKQYTSVYNRAISIKMKITSFILQIANIKRANLNLKANITTNLTIHLKFFFKYFFDIKDILYITKKVIDLQIIHIKNKMTQKSLLITSFHNTKVS